MININRLNQNNNYSLENPKIPTKRSTLIMRETNQTTGDVGKIIPFFVHEMLPSETFKANTMAELQFTPFVTNLVHEMKGEIRTYFVPYRIIWDKWERFITGCDEENDEIDGTIMEELPKINSFWITNAIVNKLREKARDTDLTNQEWESRINNEAQIILQDWIEELTKQRVVATDAEKTVITNVTKAFLREAYYNMRTNRLNKPMVLITMLLSSAFDESEKTIKQMKAYSKATKKWLLETNYDYYGLPIQENWIFWQAEDIKTKQETVIEISTSGTTEVTTQQIYNNTNIKSKIDYLTNTVKTERPIVLNFWAYNKIYNDWIRRMDWEPRVNKDNMSTLWGNYENDIYTRARRYQLRGAMPTVPVNLNGALTAEFTGSLARKGTYTGLKPEDINSWTNGANAQIYKFGDRGGIQDPDNYGKLIVDTENIDVNVIGTSTKLQGNGNWNILDMTTPAGILNYYLANARIKPRYAEQLLARWGVTIQDARFQYAQFVDSTRINITQNGVTQTSPQSGESTAQGNITGQAWGNGDGNIRFYAPEHGVLISYIQITPANAYENGMKREYLKKTKFDFPTPELVDTPDVPLYKSELVINSIDNVEENELGYIAIYDEYRTKTNRVTGLLRPSIKGSLGAKTLARYFENDVNMETVIKCKPDMARIKQFTTQPDFILYTQTSIKTNLPLPYINDPRIMI